MGNLLLDAVGAKVQSFVQERGKLQGALRDERAFVPVSGAKEGADFPQVDDGRVVGGLHGRQGAPRSAAGFLIATDSTGRPETKKTGKL